jgi:hypothetical protein
VKSPDLAATTPKEKKAATANINLTSATVKRKQPAQKLPVAQDNSIANNAPSPQRSLPVEKTAGTQELPQQMINKQPVTTDLSPAYNNTNTLAVTEPGPGTDLASVNKKGSVRGFLRKATRFIERRTGINPVNEDDELLIGVVAIKL